MFEKGLVKSNLSHIGSFHNAVSKDTRIKRARKTDKWETEPKKSVFSHLGCIRPWPQSWKDPEITYFLHYRRLHVQYKNMFISATQTFINIIALCKSSQHCIEYQNTSQTMIFRQEERNIAGVGEISVVDDDDHNDSWGT